MSDLVLASGSPRRAELLRQLGLVFSTLTPDIDEHPLARESASDYANRMSRAKFDGANSMTSERATVTLISADTVVVRDGKILGKPRGEEECVDMLMSLSGRDHNVMTSVTMGIAERAVSTFLVETIVRFRRLTSEECRDYWATGEPCDKAGAYGIQGVGAIFVEWIGGSYSNVVGLPLMEVAQSLRQFGIDCLDCTRTTRMRQEL